MHNNDTKSQFIELRAKGWSLLRIADKLDVSKRTLVDWNYQHREELRLLRAAETEALQEKILASHKTELACLARRLAAVERELDVRELDDKLRYENLRDLYRTAALLRAEIRKVRIDTDFTPAPEKPCGSGPEPAPALSDGAQSPITPAAAVEPCEPQPPSVDTSLPVAQPEPAAPDAVQNVPTLPSEELHPFCTVSAPPSAPTPKPENLTT